MFLPAGGEVLNAPRAGVCIELPWADSFDMINKLLSHKINLSKGVLAMESVVDVKTRLASTEVEHNEQISLA